MGANELRVREVLQSKLGVEDVGILLRYLEEKSEESLSRKKSIFLTKDDKLEMKRAIFLVIFFQFISIAGSVLLMLKMVS